MSSFNIYTILFIRSVIPTFSSKSLFLKNLVSKLLIRSVLCPNLIWWPSLFLIPFIGFLASKYYTYIIAVILLFSKIMLMCSYYAKKKLVYIVIIASFSCQSSFCFKCTKSNIYLSCNVWLVLNIKYIFLFILNLSHPNNNIT